MVLDVVVRSLWFILPAYVANAAPILIKGHMPIDLRARFGKYRILGDGKTFEGAVGGILLGTFAGFLQMSAMPYLPEMGLMRFSLALAFLLSLGAILGDMTGAFIKRRLGIPRGYPAPLLDQLDFLVGALLAASASVAIDKSVAVTLLVLTPVIHLGANRISFWLKMKKVPW